MKDIVLASASPRRAGLLSQIGVDFRIVPPEADEVIGIKARPEETVQRLSRDKALSVARGLKGEALVIGADTVVVKNGILGKPENEEQAFKMLKSLQGGWHEVLTGITVADAKTARYLTGFEKTRVRMRDLTDEMIYSYICTKEPMDKAGAYGIQGVGAVLVEKIEGCYFNVVGLPLFKLSRMLGEFGVSIL